MANEKKVVGFVTPEMVEATHAYVAAGGEINHGPARELDFIVPEDVAAMVRTLRMWPAFEKTADKLEQQAQEIERLKKTLDMYKELGA